MVKLATAQVGRVPTNSKFDFLGENSFNSGLLTVYTIYSYFCTNVSHHSYRSRPNRKLSLNAILLLHRSLDFRIGKRPQIGAPHVEVLCSYFWGGGLAEGLGGHFPTAVRNLRKKHVSKSSCCWFGVPMLSLYLSF